MGVARAPPRDLELQRVGPARLDGAGRGHVGGVGGGARGRLDGLGPSVGAVDGSLTVALAGVDLRPALVCDDVDCLHAVGLALGDDGAPGFPSTTGNRARQARRSPSSAALADFHESSQPSMVVAMRSPV